MAKILQFGPRKLGGEPRRERRPVFTCRCGCQEFWFHEDGSVSCTACEQSVPIHWEPNPGPGA